MEAAKFLPLLWLLFWPSIAQAQYEYTIQQGTITLTAYTGSDGIITLPDTIEGLPVTTIGNGAFAGRTGVTRINIPDSVTTIGSGAFANCYDLSSVTIGSNVTTIGDSAFADCLSLTRVTIPDGVRTIEARAFASCSSLNSIGIGPNVLTLGEGAFEHCFSLTGVTIPGSVTTIGDRAFADCTALTAITVDTLNSVYHSVEGVLFNQSQTRLIQYPRAKTGSTYPIPDSVTAIGDAAFAGCYRLAHVVIPASVATIGEFAFINCYNLTNITADASNASYRSVEGVLFNQSQTRLLQYPAGKIGSAYAIPSSVTVIEDGAFSGCYRLASITLPERVTTLGDYAFSGTSLTTVTIPSGVTAIGTSVFAYCSSLAHIVLPEQLTLIGPSAFAYCSHLASVTIPEGVITIGDAAFERCYGLTGVTIPGSVTTLGNYAFAYNSSLTNVLIPAGVLALGERAFTDCTGLTAITVDSLNAVYRSVDGVLFNQNRTHLLQYPAGKTEPAYSIPAGVTALGDAAFANCVNLVSVAIPDSVTLLGDETFAACPSLTSVYFAGNAPALGLDSFTYSAQAVVYYLPQTLGWDGTFAGRPTVLWNPRAPNHDSRLGIQEGQFGFTLTGTKGLVIVVEACTDLTQPVWTPVSTHTLTNSSIDLATNGSADFSDPEWTHHPRRFYRFRSP